MLEIVHVRGAANGFTEGGLLVVRCGCARWAGRFRIVSEETGEGDYERLHRWRVRYKERMVKRAGIHFLTFWLRFWAFVVTIDWFQAEQRSSHGSTTLRVSP